MGYETWKGPQDGFILWTFRLNIKNVFYYFLTTCYGKSNVNVKLSFTVTGTEVPTTYDLGSPRDRKSSTPDKDRVDYYSVSESGVVSVLVGTMMTWVVSQSPVPYYYDRGRR